MNRDEIDAFMSDVTFMPGHNFAVMNAEGGGTAIAIHAQVPDSDNPVEGETVGFLGYQTVIPENATEEFLIRELRFLAHRWVIHESDEFLRYKGVKIFDPHRNVLPQPGPRTAKEWADSRDCY